MRPTDNRFKREEAQTDPSKLTPQQVEQRFWEETPDDQIEHIEQNTVFELKAKDADKCRYTLTDPNRRLAECTVHSGSFSHGLILHPAHLYNLDEGGKIMVFNLETKEWQPYIPDFRSRAASR